MNCTIRVAKTKALISFAVTARLICAFVFAYADCCFSYAAAQLLFHNAYCTHQNESTIRTDNTTVYTFFENFYSNL